MNCREFEQIAADLAGRRPLEATRQQQALAHATQCSSCAAHLQDQRQLDFGLRSFAAASATAAATPQRKTDLLAAFAQQHAATPRTAEIPPAMVPEPQPKKVLAFAAERPRRWAKVGLAAAATVLVAFTLLLAAQWRRAEAPAEPVLARDSAQPATPTATAAATPRVTPDVAANQQTANKQVEVRATASPTRPRRQPGISASKAAPLLAQTTNRAASQTATNRNEFIPLTYATHAQSLQNGLLVRVEVPRATLLAMGLPLATERVSETVKADVMMGEDGVAYAIRLVNATGQ